MYLSHFGLNQSPFSITPNPTFFYAGSKRGAILEALIYAVAHGEGIIKVTGEVGSGKTMLCRMLEGLLPSNVEVIYLVNPTLSRDDVVYAIAGELGLATDGKRPDEVIRLLQHDLIAKHAEGKQVVLLVEEAQAMPLDTLEEIRLFSNLETAHHKLLQIVLFGQPELDESLSLPRMRQLKERITHSFKIPPLVPTLLPEFLMFRMRAAGYHGPDIFTKSAIQLMASVSEGIIRRVSILADKSLLAAFADNTHTISAKHVKAAVQDSEFSSTSALAPYRTLAIVLGLSATVLVSAGLGWQDFWLHGKSIPPVQPASAPAARAASASVVTIVAPTTSQTSPALQAAPTMATSTALESARAASSPTESAARRPEENPAVAVSVDPARTSVTWLQRLTLSKEWLSTEAPEHYSIQLTLMAADKRAQIERFLQKTQGEIGAENLHMYPSRVAGVPRFGVVYGSFATRAEAQAKRVELADQWGYRPQLRTIAGIRDEIKRSRSDDLWPQ
ncbi:MAG TPA: sporulation protein [Oxalobacteraceae bacterium]|nr:sporulation protein [Oxalobacteraceae bacterium]